MIKKCLLWIISFVLFWISFSFAVDYKHNSQQTSQIWTSITSQANDSYNLLVNWKWNLLTQYFWVWKRLFQIQDWTYFLWAVNSWGNIRPYMYVSTYYQNWIKKSTQWFLETYLLCDYDWSWSTYPTNCTRYYIDDWNFDNWATRIMSTLNNNWYYYYHYLNEIHTLNYTDVKYWWLLVCFWSSNFNKSLCFYWWLENFYCQAVSNCTPIINSFYLHSCNWWSYCSLSNLAWWSLSLSPYFDNINGSILMWPPWYTENPTDTTAIYTQTCPLIKDVMANMWTQYNTWLCYSNSYTMSWTTVISKTPMFIRDVFTDYDDFNNYMNLYDQYCTPPATSESCGNAFAWLTDKYQIVSKVYNKTAVESKTLWNYCYMSTLPANSTTCTASWTNLWWWIDSNPTPDELVSSVAWWQWSYMVVTPWSWTVASQVVWSDTFSGDIITNIQNIYAKFTSFFTTQTWNTKGVLPSYIIWMLLVIILFRLFKR